MKVSSTVGLCEECGCVSTISNYVCDIELKLTEDSVQICEKCFRLAYQDIIELSINTTKERQGRV